MSYNSCFQTSSISLSCASNVGGVKKVYLVAGSITGTTFDSDGSITGITGTGDIYTYEVQKQTSSLTETFNSSLENGTLFYSQELLMAFHKIEQDKRNQVKLMAQNRGLKAFVEDNNGTIFYLGGDFDGGFLSAGTSTTGTAFGDANQYSVTLTFYSADPMNMLSGSLDTVVSGLTINS